MAKPTPVTPVDVQAVAQALGRVADEIARVREPKPRIGHRSEPRHFFLPITVAALRWSPEGMRWKTVPSEFVTEHDEHAWVDCACGHAVVLAPGAIRWCPGDESCQRTFLNFGSEVRAARLPQ